MSQRDVSVLELVEYCSFYYGSVFTGMRLADGVKAAI